MHDFPPHKGFDTMFNYNFHTVQTLKKIDCPTWCQDLVLTRDHMFKSQSLIY